MPSIQDVADQINAKLDSIKQNTAATRQNTADTFAVSNDIKNELSQVNNRLDSIDVNIQTGLATLSQGLFALAELEKAALSMLGHHSAQNDTLICLNENTNELLCGITRKLTRQLDLSENILASVSRMEGIAERVHADAAGDFDRMADLQAEIRECCPPPKSEPEPCPDPCKTPRFSPYQPRGQDWKPLPVPHSDDKKTHG